jgi:multidrug efflux system outer membrane protein
MKSTFYLVSGALAFLSGCAVGPKYTPPETAAPSAYSQPTPQVASDLSHWVDAYEDAQLAQLVKQARLNNHSLAALYQNTLQARALIRRERSAGRPQLDGATSYTRSDDSKELGRIGNNDEETYETAVTLGWEIDLFGRVARLVDAAQAEAEAAEALYEDLLLITETDVAINYFRLSALVREIEAVVRSVGTRREALDIVKKRFQSGAVSDLDVAQSETLLAESEAELSVLLRQRETLEHAIAVLTGQAATDFEIQASALDGAPALIPTGLPSELLQRRPDLQQAERSLAAANARVGLATANFYPRITIGGNGGFAALKASDWFQSSAGFYSYGPQIYLPIFQGGRLRAELSQSEYAYAASLERYRQAVLVAFAEVEDALSGCHHLAVQRAARERAANSAVRAQEISNQQYRNGLVDFTTTLDSERVALDAERRLAQVISDEYENSVRLIRAIGGAWE